MFKIKKVTFNDGFLSATYIEQGTKKVFMENVPFGYETVTENRFNAALFTNTRIERVIHVPFYKSFPNNSTISIENEKYSIWKQQIIKTTNPPIIVLQLKEFE